MSKKKQSLLERFSFKATQWIGTPESILVHTLIFVGIFALIPIFGVEKTLLAFTTILSIEAIYIGLFVQMTVTSSHQEVKEDIKEVAGDVDDILEDTEDLTEGKN